MQAELQVESGGGYSASVGTVNITNCYSTGDISGSGE